MKATSFALVVALGAAAFAGADQAVAASRELDGPTDIGAHPEQGSPAALAAKADVMVLLAKNDNSGIDPAIGKIPELTKPPLSSFNSYKLLQKGQMDLEKDVEKKFDLPDKSTLTAKLSNVTRNKDKPEKKFAVSITIPKSLPSVEVSATENEWFFLVPGIKFEGGQLVIGLRLH